LVSAQATAPAILGRWDAALEVPPRGLTEMARIVQQRLGIAQIDDIQHQGPIYGQLSQTYERGGPKLTTAAASAISGV
jgi:hypothetical protein